MDRAIERSSDKLVWYRETIKTKKKVSGAYRRQQNFDHAQSNACAPKVYHEEILSSALRGNATAQVRPLSALCMSDVIVAWKRVDGITKMKSMNGGKVTAR